MLVILDPGEMAVAQILATLRRSVNQAAGVTDRRRDTSAKDALALEVMGCVAEVAFGKAYNCYPDLTVTPRSGGWDAVLNGKRWDIKATDKPHHRLIASPDKSPGDADRFALAIVTENTVNLVGWAPAGKLLHPSTLTDLGHGLTHVLTQEQLQPFPEVSE